MTVTLPETMPRTVEWTAVDFGGVQRGAVGGAAQRVNRLGNRWSVTVTLPPMAVRDAAEWSADLTAGLRAGVLWRIRQKLVTGAPGNVLVAGAGQGGTSLIVDGMTVGHAWKKGQMLSILTGGRRYVHQLSAAGATSSGSATLPVEPPLRVSPADNAVVEMAKPWIEGLLVAVPPHLAEPGRIAGGFAFTIEEAR